MHWVRKKVLLGDRVVHSWQEVSAGRWCSELSKSAVLPWPSSLWGHPTVGTLRGFHHPRSVAEALRDFSVLLTTGLSITDLTRAMSLHASLCHRSRDKGSSLV